MSVHAEGGASILSKLRSTPLFTAILVVTSAAFSLGLAFALYYALDGELHRTVIIIFSALVVGLAMGLLARLALPTRGRLLRFLLALFGVCLSLIFLGWLSGGILGIQARWTGRERIDWAGLGQVGLAAITTWLSVRAWSADTAPVPQRSTRRPALRVRLSQIPTRLRVAARARGAKMGRRAQLRGLPVKRRAAPGLKRGTPLAVRKRQRVQLSKAVEHRCPYCLELVAQDDPRGVKVCPECRAWHHADCWAVTGTCQVPHYHAT